MLFDGMVLTEPSKVKNLTVDSGNAFPSTPTYGELFFLSTDSSLYMYNTAWVKVLSIKDIVYDISLSYPSDISPNDTILIFSAPRAFKLVVDSGMYYGTSLQPSGTETIFSIKKNGVQVGTITFPANSATPTFSIPTETSFITGDYITIQAPATTPHGQISLVLKAVLT